MKKSIKLLLIILISITTFSFIDLKKPSKKFLDNHTISLNQQPSLKGIYKRTKWGIYTAFEFKSKNTVIIHGFGLEFTASYKRDGNLVTIKDRESKELTLMIINNSKLVGRGFAKGTYKK